MKTIAEYQSARSKQDKDDYSNTGEIAVGVIWLAFYLVIFVNMVASPIFSTTIEIATRY